MKTSVAVPGYLLPFLFASLLIIQLPKDGVLSFDLKPIVVVRQPAHTTTRYSSPSSFAFPVSKSQRRRRRPRSPSLGVSSSIDEFSSPSDASPSNIGPALESVVSSSSSSSSALESASRLTTSKNGVLDVVDEDDGDVTTIFPEQKYEFNFPSAFENMFGNNDSVNENGIGGSSKSSASSSLIAGAIDQNPMVRTVFLSSLVGLVAYKISDGAISVPHDWTTVSEIVRHVPATMWAGYSNVLATHPVATKAVTSATVYTIGDVLAQTTELQQQAAAVATQAAESFSSNEGVGVGNSQADGGKASASSVVGEIDSMRVLRSLLAGLIGHGPLSHCWYNVCDHLFTDVFSWHGMPLESYWWNFIPKIVMDQTTWGPIWNNTYILLIALMRFDTNFETIFGEMRRTTIPLIVKGLKLWPLAHCITYGLIPVENRLLWVDAVEILWVTILATTAANAHTDAEHIHEEQVGAAAELETVKQ